VIDIVVATRNQGKLREFRAILELENFKILSLDDVAFHGEILEDGSDYLENARKKSKIVAEACGKIVIADDSGIEIDALDGKPGVHSARFGGDGLDAAARNKLVLELLKSVPHPQRTARFRCVISISQPGGMEYHCEGVCEGFITRQGRGGKGFGYDPIFLLPEIDKTMAELDPVEKNRISHRAMALEKARNEYFKLHISMMGTRNI
jgi:XTP/dITP diphosphohydrolase